MSISKSAARPRPIQVQASRTLVAAAVAAALAGTLQTAHAADEPGLEEVTVTGSRIVRRDLTAASPIVTVDAQSFENISTVGVESALNKMPQFRGAIGTQFVATDVQASAFNNPGVSSLNLRGLGPNRNLVLIDGRRAQPANATLTVDVNSIPAAAIANVEIISGGASSVYGADAIAGVVNFKLKNNFEGLSVDAQSAVTEHGGGTESRISTLMGANFADGRGNVLAAVEWSKRDGVAQRDRDFYVAGWDDPGTTGAALTNFGQFVPSPANAPLQPTVNSIFGTTGTTVSRLTNFYFNRDGTLFKQSPARRFNSPEPGLKLQSNNALGEADRTGLASSPLTRYSIFSRGTFKFNDNVSAFIQGNLSSFTVSQILGYAPATSFWGAQVPRDAAHPVPAELAALLDSRPDPNASWQMDRVLDYIGPRRSRNDSDVYQVMAGLNGNLGLGDWTWEAYGSHGETRITNYLNGGFVSVERYRKLIAAPNYGKGYTVGDPSGILGYKITCTSGLPVFNNFPVTQDCIDAMSSRMKNITNLKQNIAEVNLQGGIADLPGGQLRGAFGVSYRKNTFAFDPDVLNDTESVLDGPVGLFASNDTNGMTEVKEVYGELLVPVLKDLPAVKTLSLELGARHSDYNTAGGVNTFKALANWSVDTFVSFRGGIQVATRAPNVAELYTGPTVFVAGFPNSDPCANTTLAPWGNVPSNPNRAKVQQLCSQLNGTGTSVFDADPNGFIGGNGGYFGIELENRRGNTELQTETAHTLTIGTVLKSPFEGAAVSNMSAAIDYYRIRIADAISPLPSTTVYENCFNVNGTSNPTYDVTNEYCKLIKRDGVTGGRVSVDAPYSNLGAIHTSGVDFQFNWRSELGDLGLKSVPGAVSLDFSLNYLISYKTQSVPGSVFIENQGTLAQNGQYEYVADTNLGYTLGGWKFGLEWRRLPSVANAAKATTPTSTIQGTDAYDLFNFSANWSLNRTVSLRVGVDNLLDKDPLIVGYNPGVNNAQGATAPGFYDILGRRYYAGVKLDF
ncbi:MAG: TonB-dependent receptor [Gammaproteobacteria bacterium]